MFYIKSIFNKYFLLKFYLIIIINENLLLSINIIISHPFSFNYNYFIGFIDFPCFGYNYFLLHFCIMFYMMY